MAQTLKELEQTIWAEYSQARQKERQEQSSMIDLSVDEVVHKLRGALPGYLGLIHNDSAVSEMFQPDTQVVDVASRITHQAVFSIKIEDNSNQEAEIKQSTADLVQAFVQSKSTWKDLSVQLDEYVKNHPVMGLPEPPAGGVIGIGDSKVYTGIAISPQTFETELMCKISIPVKVYFQP